MNAALHYLVRPFEDADAPSMYAAVQASMAELLVWMPWCKPDYALADAEAWVRHARQAWSDRSEFALGIFERASGAMVGGTGINHLNKVHRMGNVGYWVSTPHVGRGVARFAARQAALLGLVELGLTRVEIVALTHNLASQRVAEAVGATRECVARNRLYFQGQPHDAVVFSLTPHDVARWTEAGAGVASAPL